MSRPHSSIVAAALIAVSACFTGPAVGSFQPAMGPRGVETTLRLARGRIDGELLEARDSAFVVADSSGIVFVLYPAVRGANFHRYVTTYEGGTPDEDELARIRLVSRYPTGMPAGVLERLLAEAGQTAPRTIAR